MGGVEQKFGEMANQEDLGNKPSKKLKLPEKDLNYLCENSCRFLGASTTKAINVIQIQKLRIKVVMKVKKVLRA